jgi:non-ribosomal peptide synthetase component E (peptide arylation enzyme)
MSDQPARAGVGGDSIVRRLTDAARDRPDSVAIVDADRRVTYADLDAASEVIARGIVAACDGCRGIVCLMLTD